MTKQECLELQQKLNGMGANLKEDGIYGPLTRAAEKKYLGEKDEAKPIPGAPTAGDKILAEAHKHMGKHETDSKFAAFMNTYWKAAGLPGYRGLSGSARAWCGIFVLMAFMTAGYQGIKGAAGARNWGHSSNVQIIDHKRMGIPRGAGVHTNHAGNCKSGKNNHVGLSEGDCTPDDLKSGTFRMTGGNQSNRVSTVNYPVYEICEVVWPKYDKDGKPVALPKLPITKSNGCKGKAERAGSTR